MKNKFSVLFLLILLCSSANAIAGPPYDTDDPEPVDFRHWEFYCASHISNTVNSWSGTAPHIEVNYGLVHNVQVHLIAPAMFNIQKGDGRNYGYGDTELGAKYRFIQEDSSRPQIGTFPLIELPTGNAGEGLGNGKTQIYLPIWIQKTFGKWTTYGGVGYWINPGEWNHNYWFIGWQAQYQLLKSVSFGGELYYVTASQDNKSEVRFNVGAVIDFTEHHHLLFSMGKSINGGTNLQGYIGYQITI